MISISGDSASKGIAMGSLRIFKSGAKVERMLVSDVEAESERFLEAVHEAKRQLNSLKRKANSETIENGAQILEAHEMLMDDENFKGEIIDYIKEECVNAEYALVRVTNDLSEEFASLDDDYISGRSADIRQVSSRLLTILSGKDMDFSANHGPEIVIADELTPGEIVYMGKKKLAGCIIRQGAYNSHASIILRSMGIPAVIGVEVNPDLLKDGMTAVVNGNDGSVILDPTEEIASAARKEIVEQAEKTKKLAELKGVRTRTGSGREVLVSANIGSVLGADNALLNDAEGIGLFRSEFLFLGRNRMPSEDEQFEAYKTVAQKMEGKRVVIRTLDMGADKQVPYIMMRPEVNPALGMRGIRLCFKEKEIFKTQLRAILRASVYGNIAIMYPMIVSDKEVLTAKALLNEAVDELKERNVEYKVPKQGVMIETPAAVMIMNELCDVADFFSIGTNDLVQYSLALDRQSPGRNGYGDMHHPAIIRMIDMCVKTAREHGKHIGICGELGADTTLTRHFVETGIDELSVAPSMVLKIREEILNLE